MSENKIINEVVVDNKLKKIYQEFGGYQDLNEAEQNFFDQIFNLLWFNEKLEHTNKYLAERLGYSVSTIEKRFKAISNAKLITRELHPMKDPVTNRWETKRIIMLDPFIRSIITKKIKPVPADVAMPTGIHEEPVPADVSVDAVIPGEVVPTDTKKKKNVRFNYGKIR